MNILGALILVAVIATVRVDGQEFDWLSNELLDYPQPIYIPMPLYTSTKPQPQPQEISFFSLLHPLLDARIKATPQRDWFSSTPGSDPCPSVSLRKVVGEGPTQTISVAFFSLCSLSKAPRDVGKIRIPVFFVPSSSQTNITIPLGATLGSQSTDPEFNYRDLSRFVRDFSGYDFVDGAVTGEQCEEVLVEQVSNIPTPTFQFSISFVPLCSILDVETGYADIEVPVIHVWWIK